MKSKIKKLPSGATMTVLGVPVFKVDPIPTWNSDWIFEASKIESKPLTREDVIASMERWHEAAERMARAEAFLYVTPKRYKEIEDWLARETWIKSLPLYKQRQERLKDKLKAMRPWTLKGYLPI